MSLAGDLVILGAGGMGQEVADIVRAAASDGTRWRLIGFIDDDRRAARPRGARVARAR